MEGSEVAKTFTERQGNDLPRFTPIFPDLPRFSPIFPSFPQFSPIFPDLPQLKVLFLWLFSTSILL